MRDLSKLRIIVTGGENDMAGQMPLVCVEAYDPKTNKWSTRPSMQYPRADHSIVAVGIDLLVIGSGRPAQAAPEQNPLVVTMATTADWVAPAEMYDSVKKKWFALPMQEAPFSLGESLKHVGLVTVPRA